MAIDPEYIRQLNDYLNNPDQIETAEETEQSERLDGNVSIYELRDSEQGLLSIVIDKSISMHYNGLDVGVKHGLKEIKRVVNGRKEVNYIQTAMTFFGSTLDMRPFQYGENIDISYEANETSTRLYDAVVESCKNMVAQYDYLKSLGTIKGVMLIFTDGEENGSEVYRRVEDVQNALNELTKREIRYIVAAFKEVNIEQLARDFKTKMIIIDDDYKLRKLMRFTSMTAMR